MGVFAVRQIAALPYRRGSQTDDAPVSILLVTSRDTKRWVIPKGNQMTGLAAHEAAAWEAEEEAGVRGAVSPDPIGSYRYGKRQSNDNWVVIDVDVFALEVSKELAKYKECGERERKWFTLADAGAAVEEPDLRELIWAFGERLQGDKSGT